MIVRRLEKLHNIILPYAQRLNIPFIFVTARFKYNIVLASRLASSTTHKTRRYKYKRYVETLSIWYIAINFSRIDRFFEKCFIHFEQKC